MKCNEVEPMQTPRYTRKPKDRSIHLLGTQTQSMHKALNPRRGRGGKLPEKSSPLTEEALLDTR